VRVFVVKDSAGKARPCLLRGAIFGARLLHRKAERVVLWGPFRRQVGGASDAHAMREPAIDGDCSELATDNRLVVSSSPPSPPLSLLKRARCSVLRARG
jgi:hypothetical protein